MAESSVSELSSSPLADVQNLSALVQESIVVIEDIKSSGILAAAPELQQMLAYFEELIASIKYMTESTEFYIRFRDTLVKENVLKEPDDNTDRCSTEFTRCNDSFNTLRQEWEKFRISVRQYLNASANHSANPSSAIIHDFAYRYVLMPRL